MTSVRMLEVGPLSCCSYIVNAGAVRAGAGAAPEPCVVIDPGGDAGVISAAAREAGLEVAAIFLTHAHVDHIGGVDDLLSAWPGSRLMCSAETSRRAGDPRLNLSVYMGREVTAKPAGRLLADGEEFTAAGMQWRAVEVPGHDPGEMVYILDGGGVVFTGDTLFEGSIGRSDFPGGDGRLLVAGVKQLLASLPPDAVIYPGHGGETTARMESEYNPFLR